MRIALCLHGKIGGLHGKNGKGGGEDIILRLGYAHFKQHIFDVNPEIDVFVHTWDEGWRDDIVAFYNPKSIQTEPPITFKIPNYVQGDSELDPMRRNNHYSRWYSAKKCLEIKKEYETKNNFKYDCVILTRFDMCWRAPLVFNEYDMEHIWTPLFVQFYYKDERMTLNEYYRRRESLDLKHITTEKVGWPHDNREGFWDALFFSNSLYMDRFTEMFERLDEYLKYPGGCWKNNPKLRRKIQHHYLTQHHLEEVGLIEKVRTALRIDQCSVIRCWYPFFHKKKPKSNWAL